MVKTIKKIALTAAVVSALFSNTVFAAVLYAPGASANAGGPVSSTSSVIDATQGVATAAHQDAAAQAQAAVQNNGSGKIGPSGSAGGVNYSAQAGGGSAGSGVSADPILGQTPLINAVMIDTNGNAEAPFSTNTEACISTTEGFSGLWLCYDQAIGDVYYRVFTNEHGWSKWAMNEMRTPDAAGAKVTAVEIRTTGYTHNEYSIYYRAILNDGTSLGWARDGQAAGAFGNGKYIQGLEIKLYKRGTGTAANYQQGGAYEGVMIGGDGLAHYSTFDGRAFTGWAYDTDNNKYYFSNNNIVTGWQYIDGYKYYFDERGRVVTDLEPIIGVTHDYIIKINKSMKTMTIYGKDGDNGYIMPVKVILNTIGKSTPIGTFKTYEGYRWKYMHDAEGGAYYCQFLLRFKNGFLLHSIIYQGAADSYHLIADTYNMLGKNQSDGCVRMLSGDAAWVYNNCGVGTQVVIYEDDWSVGPFDRPAIERPIPRTQTYDPTDPVVVSNLAAAELQAAAEAAKAASAEAATGIEAAPTTIDN